MLANPGAGLFRKAEPLNNGADLYLQRAIHLPVLAGITSSDFELIQQELDLEHTKPVSFLEYGLVMMMAHMVAIISMLVPHTLANVVL